MAKIERNNMTLKDSKGKVLRKPKVDDTGDNFNWWDKDGSELADSVASTLKQIQMGQSSRIEQLTMSTRLYGATAAYNLLGSSFIRSAQSSPSTQRLSYNLCSSVIDTLQAKMAKNKIIPTYITNGAVWENQKKASQLTKFTQGIFYEHKIHPLTIDAFSDASVWGDSFIHPYRGYDDKLCIEKDLPHEIWVDYVESAVSEPKQLHRVKIRDREWALKHYPELKDQINTISPVGYADLGAQKTVADLISVVESWRLPIGDEPGWYAVTIGKDSIKKEYNKKRFPFAHLDYVKRKLGYYGQGVCERLQNIQGEINRTMILKQRSQWMMGSFKILVENGSKVVSQHLNNEVGTIVTYSGTPPQYVVPPASNPELDRWIDSLIQKGYDQEGVSKLSTTGQVPLGVESGKAMRTLNQITDDRFIFTSQKMEEFALDIASLCIDVIKDIFKDKGTYKVTFPQTNFIETVDWKEVDLEEDSFWLKAFPTSSLSDDISGRLSEVQELMQAGLISPRTGKKLLDMPDIEMANDLENAAYDLLCDKIEKMLYDSQPYSPEPFNDLSLAMDLAIKYYNYALLHNCPDKNLDLLRDFMSQLKDLQAQALPAPTPMANPQSAPQSNLIPNVPTAQGA